MLAIGAIAHLSAATHRKHPKAITAAIFLAKVKLGYSEKIDVTQTHTGGVVLMPAPAADHEAWRRSLKRPDDIEV